MKCEPKPLMSCERQPGQRERVRVVVHGAVQGVGFRPYVFRLAEALELRGWVNNSPQGALIEVEGAADQVREFLVRLEPERPPHSFIQSLEATHFDPTGYQDFTIRPSDPNGARTTLILPDIATCSACLQEVLDPQDRRFNYPFTNCTHCGPRFTIIESLPYDRANTSMCRFRLCSRCQQEYLDPHDRRFHAQPNACPECGPHLELWDPQGRVLKTHRDALREAAWALREGAVVAVKGMGGFHLMVLAADTLAVEQLRERKQREEKPLAVMVPDLASACELCEIDDLERRLLCSAEAPIVLLRRRGDTDGVSSAVAPGNPTLGLMLPYTPLHHLLMRLVGQPVVATSGNRSDEPICTDEQEALRRLAGIADLFLVHNRPIVRHVDDSLVRVVLGREMVLRRARGYAPLPVTLDHELPPVLAVGAHQKNTIAYGRGRHVFLSQHIGDLETEPASDAFEQVVGDLGQLLEVKPKAVATDLHPDYRSTQYARQAGYRVLCVQHHFAHVLACMAENRASRPFLGVSWDGTGYGTDETVWGGEFLAVSDDSWERVAHLRAFRLPGGEMAVKQPRRSALGLLYSLLGRTAFDRHDLALFKSFSQTELQALRWMLESNAHAPVTTSAGRLFDAVASLLDLRQQVSFEGQAAIDLEFSVGDTDLEDDYPISLRDPKQTVPRDGEAVSPARLHAQCVGFKAKPPRWVLDWGPMIEAMLREIGDGIPVWEIAAKFHNTLAQGIVLVAKQVNLPRVVLSGGCFQNRYLVERVVARLRYAGLRPYWHQRVPPNDGGIALGQTVAIAQAFEQEQRHVSSRSRKNLESSR